MGGVRVGDDVVDRGGVGVLTRVDVDVDVRQGLRDLPGWRSAHNR